MESYSGKQFYNDQQIGAEGNRVAFVGFNNDVATVGSGDFYGEVQAQAKAARFPVAGRVGSVKTVEHMSGFFFWNGCAGVLHSDFGQRTIRCQ
jgi:hypothetical protein